MLRYTHRPEDTDSAGFRNHVRDFLQRFPGNTADLRGKLHGKGLQRFLILFQSVHPFAKEVLVRETILEQITSDRRKPDQIRSRLGVQEEVSASRHLVLAQIGYDEFLAVKFVGALHTSGKHRMTLRRITADDQYQACILN